MTLDLSYTPVEGPDFAKSYQSGQQIGLNQQTMAMNQQKGVLAQQDIATGQRTAAAAEQLPGALAAYKAGDQSALAQIAASGPQGAAYAQEINNMATAKREGALVNQQIKSSQQEMQQRGMQLNLQKLQMEGISAANLKAELQGVNDPEQAQKIVDIHVKQFEGATGTQVHPELKKYSPEMLQHLDEIASQGQTASMMLNPPAASPGYMFMNGKEVPIPGAPPKYEKMGDTLYAETPGQEPKPVASNATTTIDPNTGQLTGGGAAIPLGGAQPTDTFGFKLPPTSPAALHLQQKNDAAQQKSEETNRSMIMEMQSTLQALKQNNDLYNTGRGKETIAHMGQVVNSLTGLNEDSATASNNLEKGANDFLAEAMKLQPVGSRVTNAQLQIQQAGKPGLSNQHATNVNILNEWQGRIDGIQLSNDLAQQYREESPLKVTDSNTTKLDDALHAIYPLVTVKDGKTTYNKDNADKFRDAIPDAIANPQKYFDKAKKISGGTISYNTEGPSDAGAKVPDGAKPTGKTIGGKPVYTLPNGKGWMPD